MASRLEKIAIHLRRSPEDSDFELKAIAESCLDTSNTLLEVLTGLQNQTNQHRKLSAVRITFKSITKERVIRDLDSKLQRLQQQLNTRLLVLLQWVIVVRLKGMPQLTYFTAAQMVF